MSYRVWLPLLLMLVLAVEGVLGAWASTRMVMHAGGDVVSEDGTRVASADCDPAPRLSTLTPAHGKHAGLPASPDHQDDCSCADSAGCECLCVFTIYPPVGALLFASAHPPVSADTALPVLELPASKLSRVFRPPIA